MNLKTGIRAELVVRKMALAAAQKRLRMEESEAKREKRSVHRHVMEKLMSEINLCKANVGAAVISLDAVCMFPPLSRR